jgi:translation initiation factor IF-1
MITQVKVHLRTTQNKMAQLANKKRSERSFSIGDYVYIKLQQCKQQSVVCRSSQKLSVKFFGPCLVIDKIGNIAYKMELPLSSAIHLVFHVSQLRRHVRNRPVQSTLPNLPQVFGLQLQAILDRRITK